jgi:hypothetical protein
MAKIVPVIVARVVVPHGIERIYRHRDSRVADRMNAKLPAELMSLFDVGVDLLRREERPPAESGLSFVIYQHPCRWPGETAVGHHFSD